MSKKILILQAIALFLVVAAAFYLARLASGSEVIQEIVSSYGYGGIYFVALLSGFNIVVPLPAASFTPLFLESGLSFLPTVFIIALGMTTADSVGFYLARTGRRLISDSWGEKLFDKFQDLPEKYYRYPLAFLFIFASIVPLPNELLLLPMAFFFGYGFKELVPIMLAGNLIFNILFAKGLLNVFEALA
jgi:membrane protein YqaA with SNARE-associated domain